MFFVIYKKMAVVLIDHIGPILSTVLLLEEFTISLSAKFGFPGRHVFGRIVAVFHVSPPFQHQCFQSLLGELLGSPSAGNTGSDNNGIVFFSIRCYEYILFVHTISRLF